MTRAAKEPLPRRAIYQAAAFAPIRPSEGLLPVAAIEPTPTLRQRMSPKRRQHIFSENCTAHNVAPCCICGRPIHRHNDRWIIEHKRALGLLGPDTNPNCAPAHFDCAEVKTHEQDLPMIRKAKRQQDAGAKVPSGGLTAPAGVVFDWRQRRYRKAEQ